MNDDEYVASRRRSAARFLLLSAAITFAVALAFWNRLLPLELPDDLQEKLPAIFFFIGLLDVGVAIFLMRHSR